MLIQTATIARKLQRLLRLQSLPDSVLAAETVPVILVEDVSAPLSDEDRGCHGAQSAGAVAAENPILALVRVGAPATYDLTVSEIWVQTDTTQIITISTPTDGIAGLTASPNTQFTDQELPGRPTSQLGSDTQIGIPAGRVWWNARVLANEPKRIPVDVRIGTVGIQDDLTSIMVAGVTVNTRIAVAFTWTESSPQG